MPLGVDSSDSFFSFLTFMDAYNVKLVNDSGKLLVDDPAVRQALINALTDYTAVYTKGCTPPSSTNWKDPDNNVAFHNKTTVHDAQRDDLDRRQVARRHEQPDADRRRSATTAKQNYTEKIAHRGLPEQARRQRRWSTAPRSRPA